MAPIVPVWQLFFYYLTLTDLGYPEADWYHQSLGDRRPWWPGQGDAYCFYCRFSMARTQSSSRRTLACRISLDWIALAGNRGIPDHSWQWLCKSNLSPVKRWCACKGWLAWETFNGKFSFSLLFKGALPGVDITHDPCNHFCSFLPQNFRMLLTVPDHCLYLHDGEHFQGMERERW